MVVFLIQHNVIKFVCDLRQVGGFLPVQQFLQPIKLGVLIQLKYCGKWRLIPYTLTIPYPITIMIYGSCIEQVSEWLSKQHVTNFKGWQGYRVKLQKKFEVFYQIIYYVCHENMIKYLTKSNIFYVSPSHTTKFNISHQRLFRWGICCFIANHMPLMSKMKYWLVS
jgi:hypothetical protein